MEAEGISYFSVAAIKHCDQSNLETFTLTCGSRRLKSEEHGEMAAGRVGGGSRKLKALLLNYNHKTENKLKVSKASYPESVLHSHVLSLPRS